MNNMIISLIENYQNRASGISEHRKIEYLYDYEFARAIIESPVSHPREIHKMMCNRLQKDINFYVLGALKKNGLHNPDKRKEWVKLVTKTGHNLAYFLTEGRCDYHVLYEEIKRVVFVKNVQPPLLESKAILVALSSELIIQGIPPESFTELIQQMGFALSKMFLRDLIDLTANKHGLAVKKSISDKLRGTQDELKEMLLEKTQQYENEKEKLVAIEKENEDFRAALEIVQQQLENLQEEIKTIKTEAHQEAVISFLQEMNSSQSGHLLDQFAISEKSLKELKRRNFEMPPEIESIPALIRMFIRFVKSYGIKEKEVLGTKKINLKESELYDYVGSDFSNNREEKIVEIISSGWEYNNILISRPRVVEVIK